jgi:predicted DNA-binding transcriptional regulator AlpA
MLTRKEVAEYTGLSIETIKKYRALKTMPAPDHIYGRTPVWTVETINKWRGIK